MKISLAVLLALSLAGCATQFGTRMTPPAHHKQEAAPVVVPTPVPPDTFKQRWLHKFFVKRATEK